MPAVRSLLYVLAATAAGAAPAATDTAARYTDDGKLVFPADYRDWTYLTAGHDMSYAEVAADTSRSTFDTIFVPTPAYRAFLATGTWPERTVLLMEIRAAGSKASINRRGHFQTTQVLGFEAHVKDSARFEGGWAFFGFNGREPALELPHTASCYGCHQDHAAVDTTFVQFYPTLIDVATRHGTLSPKYLAEEAALAREAQ